MILDYKWLVDFAYFVTDFQSRAFSNDNIEKLYGVKVEDRTDVIESTRIYMNKYEKEWKRKKSTK